MKHEKERTEEEKAKADQKLLKKERQRKKKLEAAGIDYEFDGHVSFFSFQFFFSNAVLNLFEHGC